MAPKRRSRSSRRSRRRSGHARRAPVDAAFLALHPTSEPYQPTSGGKLTDKDKRMLLDARTNGHIESKKQPTALVARGLLRPTGGNTRVPWYVLTPDGQTIVDEMNKWRAAVEHEVAGAGGSSRRFGDAHPAAYIVQESVKVIVPSPSGGEYEDQWVSWPHKHRPHLFRAREDAELRRRDLENAGIRARVVRSSV